MSAENKEAATTSGSKPPKDTKGCGCLLDKSSISAIIIAVLIVVAGVALNCCEGQNKKINPTKELADQVLGKWKAVLGDKHPMVAKAIFRLGLTPKNDLAETIKAFVSILKEEQNVLEKDEYADPSDAITTMHTFAYTLLALGENTEGQTDEFRSLCFKESLKVLEDLLEIQGLAIGLGHETCYELRNKIGHVYELIGNYDQAIIFWLYVVEFKGRTLGVDHKETLEARRRIGNAMASNGQLDRSHLELHQAYELLEDNYGEDHLMTLRIQRDIAHVLYAKGSKEKARSMLQELVKKQATVLGEDHQETSLTRQSILKLSQ